jgi:Spy/CpxP family protein refolding chaperone
MAWLTVVTVLCLVLPAQAQQSPAPGRAERPRLRAAREREQAWGEMSLNELARRLAAELQLTDEQRQQYGPIVAKYNNAWEDAKNTASQRGDLAQQVRAARRSGDEAKAADLKKQVDALGDNRGQVLKEFTSEVEPILTPDQVTKLNQFRNQVRRRFAVAAVGELAWEQIQRLPNQLNLTADQRTKFNQLVAEEKARREQNQQKRRELRPLVEEMNKAKAAGDTQRAAELEQQIKAQRPDTSLKPFFDKLEPILTDEQKAKLAELRQQVARAVQGGPNTVRSVIAAARKLDLNDQQQARLKEIVRDASAAARDENMTAEARSALAERVKSQITEMLDANQTAQFEKLLQSQTRPERGPRRRPNVPGEPGDASGGQPAKPARVGGAGGGNAKP